MAVEILQLFRVKARRRFADAFEGKPFDSLSPGNDLVIAMAPAEPQQVVEHRVRQYPHVAIGVDTQRAMAFRQFGAIIAVDQRDMGIDRFGPAHRLDQRQLPEGVVEMVITADQMGHAHVMIVDDDREHIGGRAIRAQQDEVVDLAILHRNIALHHVGDGHLAGGFGFQPDHERRAFRRFRRIAVAPAAVIAHRFFLCPLLFAHRGQLFRGRETFIGIAGSQQFMGDFRMAFGAFRLEHRFTIPVEAQPVESFDDRVDRFLGRARLVGILDPQQRLAAVMAGKQPVEHRGPGTANMQKARGRRRKAGYNPVCLFRLIINF